MKCSKIISFWFCIIWNLSAQVAPNTGDSRWGSWNGTGWQNITASVTTIANLKALPVTQLVTGNVIRVQGYYAAGDGGGGDFTYNSSSSATVDNGTVVQPTVGSGRYLRIYSGPLNVMWFGAKRDGSTNDSSAIQTALNFRGSIYLPGGSGSYSIGNKTLTISNGSIIYGDGNSANGAAYGTLISYTGSSSAVAVNNPVNSSTAANITFRDLAVNSTATGTLSGCFLDVGSTYEQFERVACFGAPYGIIMDQTEIASIKNCVFNNQTTGCIWLVNGPDRNGTSNPYFTNDIDIADNAFASTGSSSFDVIDDGGASHTFYHNNFEGPGSWIRFASQTNLNFLNNELEGDAVNAPITFNTTTRLNTTTVSAGTTATLKDNSFSNAPNHNVISIVGGGNAQNSLVCISNGYQTATVSHIANTSSLAYFGSVGEYPATSLVDSFPANYDIIGTFTNSSGTRTFSTATISALTVTTTLAQPPSTYNATTTFSPVLNFGGATTGITYSTQEATYTTEGHRVFFRLHLVLTSKGSATGAATITGLPYTVVNTATYSTWSDSMGATLTGPIIAQTNGNNVINMQFVATGAASNVTDTQFTNNSNVMISGEFFK